MEACWTVIMRRTGVPVPFRWQLPEAVAWLKSAKEDTYVQQML